MSQSQGRLIGEWMSVKPKIRPGTDPYYDTDNDHVNNGWPHLSSVTGACLCKCQRCFGRNGCRCVSCSGHNHVGCNRAHEGEMCLEKPGMPNANGRTHRVGAVTLIGGEPLSPDTHGSVATVVT